MLRLLTPAGSFVYRYMYRYKHVARRRRDSRTVHLQRSFGESTYLPRLCGGPRDRRQRSADRLRQQQLQWRRRRLRPDQLPVLGRGGDDEAGAGRLQGRPPRPLRHRHLFAAGRGVHPDTADASAVEEGTRRLPDRRGEQDQPDRRQGRREPRGQAVHGQHPRVQSVDLRGRGRRVRSVHRLVGSRHPLQQGPAQEGGRGDRADHLGRVPGSADEAEGCRHHRATSSRCKACPPSSRRSSAQ